MENFDKFIEGQEIEYDDEFDKYAEVDF